jgi:hypothetical protein
MWPTRKDFDRHSQARCWQSLVARQTIERNERGHTFYALLGMNTEIHVNKRDRSVQTCRGGPVPEGSTLLIPLS